MIFSEQSRPSLKMYHLVSKICPLWFYDLGFRVCDTALYLPLTQDVPPCEQDLSFTSHKLHLDLSFTGHELHLPHLKVSISIITPSTHPRQLCMPHPGYRLLFDRINSVFSLMCLVVRASVYYSSLLSHIPLRLDSDLNPKP